MNWNTAFCVDAVGSSAEKEIIRTVVVSISPQTSAALAVQYKMPVFEITERLCGYFKSIGITSVYDIALARSLSLIESRNEFIERWTLAQDKTQVGAPTALPMLASQCPGWICYAEKTHGEFVLPYISTTKSPQQIMGTLVKDMATESKGTTSTIEGEDTPATTYHVCIMPCYDKKLEASREDFYNDIYKTRDVDCVITTGVCFLECLYPRFTHV